MVTENEVLRAFHAMLKKYKSQSELSRRTGVSQSTINDIYNKKKHIGNVSLKNILKLFPAMEINFFGSGNAQITYPEKLLKIINRLNQEEQELVYDAIVSSFPHVIDSNIKDTINKIKPINEE